MFSFRVLAIAVRPAPARDPAAADEVPIPMATFVHTPFVVVLLVRYI